MKTQEAFELTLTLDQPGRLDQCLLHELQQRIDVHFSRRSLKVLFEQDRIWIQDRPQPASHWLQPGSFRIRILGWSPDAHRQKGQQARALPSPDGCWMPVVFESPELVVFDKPAGTPSVPHSIEEIHTAVNAALARFPELASAGPDPLEGGLLHRLDTGTSGALAFARTREAYDFYKNAWKTGAIEKLYRAVCTVMPHAAPPILQKITTPLGHSSKTSKKMIALKSKMGLRQIRGKPLPARTEILAVQPLSDSRWDLTLRIETGVQHQIRCHLAAMGWPIVGDRLYGGPPADRLYLHAQTLQGTALLVDNKSGGIQMRSAISPEFGLQVQIPPPWSLQV